MRSIAGARPCDPINYYDSPEPRRALVFYLISATLLASGLLACISSGITTGIHVILSTA